MSNKICIYSVYDKNIIFCLANGLKHFQQMLHLPQKQKAFLAVLFI